MIERPYHKRLRDFTSFDEIRFHVIPRYKTSGMSGDEWRQHVQVDFLFKGEIVHETGFRDMNTALLMVGAEWMRAQEPIPDRVIEMERAGLCDQPSCAKPSEVRYLIVEQYSERGELLDAGDQHGKYYRQFCLDHARRGDCGREDSDRNYEVIAGSGPEASTNVVESPSAVVVMNVQDEPG